MNEMSSRFYRGSPVAQPGKYTLTLASAEFHRGGKENEVKGEELLLPCSASPWGTGLVPSRV